MTDAAPALLLLVAAGRGLRAGAGAPKQYRLLGGTPVIARTLTAALNHPGLDAVQPVIHPGDRALYEAAIAQLPQARLARLRAPVFGGETRGASVQAGLAALSGDPADSLVLIHDAARPFLTPALLDRALAAGAKGPAVPGLAVTDTIKRLGPDGRIDSTVDRASLRSVQTPQVFRLGPIRDAHQRAKKAGRDDFTDDAALLEWLGLAVSVFEGDAGNIKLTTQADFEMAEARLRQGLTLTTRVGTGYDVHAFGPGDHVWLCGVRLAHDRGVVAHSDGDVALHALCDALFGAMGDGDIGQHFPPSDERWRDASSDRFLAFACERLRARGGVIDHLDVTIICERPKIGPAREAMQARVAEIAGVAPQRVGLKATTSERLGFTGRGEGLAALATATIRLPEDGA